MYKHLVFVESNTTGTGLIALRCAAELGVSPVFLTNDPRRYRGLDTAGCKVVVCDTNSMESLRQAIDSQLRLEEIAGITTTSEFYLPIVAVLAEAYGLPGNPVAAMQACRNKAETRKKLAEAGVSQPAFAAVRTEDELSAALDTVGLPCVVKPADDTGSFEVRFCSTRSEAEQQVRRILLIQRNVRGQETARTVMIEEYLDAPEYSVEMFSWQGETTCVGITQKSLTGFPYFVESRHIFPAALPHDQASHAADTVKRALRAVGVTTGATHTEVKLTPTGCAIVEINARLAGGMIPELIGLSTGIDLLQQQLKASLGQAPDLTPIRREYAGIQFLVAGATGLLEEVQGVEAARRLPGVQQVVITGRLGARVDPPRSAYDRLGFLIASGLTHDETVERLAAASAHIHLVVRPEEER